MRLTLKEWARQRVLNVYEGWRLAPLTQEVCGYDLLWFFTCSHFCESTIFPSLRVQSRRRRRKPSPHMAFSLSWHVLQSTVTRRKQSQLQPDIIPASGGERHPAVQMILPETLYWWVKQVLFRTQGSDWTRSGQGGSCGDAGSRRICLVLFLDVWWLQGCETKHGKKRDTNLFRSKLSTVDKKGYLYNSWINVAAKIRNPSFCY